MIITSKELAQLCLLILKAAEKSGFEKWNLDNDYYWKVDPEDRENFSNEKLELIIGSLQDDLLSLKKVLDKTHPVTVLDLERLGNVFIALGEDISKSAHPLIG